MKNIFPMISGNKYIPRAGKMNIFFMKLMIRLDSKSKNSEMSASSLKKLVVRLWKMSLGCSQADFP